MDFQWEYNTLKVWVLEVRLTPKIRQQVMVKTLATKTQQEHAQMT